MPSPVRWETGVRDRRNRGGPLPPDVDPPLDQGLIRAGGDAQLSHSLVVGSLGLTLAVAQREPCAFGQQVGPPACDLGKFGDGRGVLLAAGAPVAGAPGCDAD